jgi:hypothetical protein
VLYLDPGCAELALIDVDDCRAFPIWERFDALAEAVAYGDVELLSGDPFLDLRPDSEIGIGTVAARDRRMAVIQSLVEPADGAGSPADILRKQTRGRLVAGAHRESGAAKDNIYKWLRQYWQRGQTPNALLPDYHRSGGKGKMKASGEKKRGAPFKIARAEGRSRLNVTEPVRKLLVDGGRRFWGKKVNGKRLNLRKAFQMTLETYFVNRLEVTPDGVPVPILVPPSELPSFRQFAYWFGKHRRAERDLTARYSARAVALRHRAVLGSSEHLSKGPGDLYLIDATVGDVYLLSAIDRRCVIGRPVIYLVVDHWSRMVTGLYVGLEGPSWLGAMMALENAFTDKVSFCARYNVEITEEDWPCALIPRSITADRGEMIGVPADHLVSAFKFQISNTPPFRADFKSFVEGQFKILNERGIERLPGWVDKARDRRDPDYRLDAKLDLRQFTTFMIHMVLRNNWYRRLENQVPIGFPRARDADPVPLDLWEWGITNRLGLGRTMDREQVRINLLPRIQATATPEGLKAHGRLHYDSATAQAEGWFLRGTGRKRKKVWISYDPRDVSKVFLRLDSGRTTEECPLTPKDALRYSGKTLEEVQDDNDRRALARELDRRDRHQDAAEQNARREAIEAAAIAEREALLGPAAVPVVNGIIESRRDQRRVIRAEEAFTRTAPALDGSTYKEEDDEYIPFPDPIYDEEDDEYIPFPD